MPKPVRLRERASTDLEVASEYYRQQAGEQIALNFIDAVERGLTRIGRRPPIGSLRFAYDLAIPELRAWPLRSFSHIVFCVYTPTVIDVWRILHTRRDIPASLQLSET